MARLVQHNAQGPVEIKAGEKSLWMCMCGLSKKKPHCDGSHAITKDEADGILYTYDKEGRRIEFQSHYN